MNARAQRIVSTAIDLAEKGGFEAVRLRDVAAEADVALGTLYRYFRSKEDLLIAALTIEVDELERRLQGRTVPGDTPLERVCTFFKAATKGMCRRPRLARAILRAAASGDHDLAEKVAGFHSRVTLLIIAALRDGDVAAVAPAESPSLNGDGSSSRDEETPPPAGLTLSSFSETENDVGLMLEYVWFAALVGWAGGLQSQNEVIERMNTAAELLLRGADLSA